MANEYYDECKKAMTWLGRKKDVVILGETVRYPGSPMFVSFADIDDDKKIETPLIEDDQLGISIGLAISGFIPISIYPRIDFLMCACNQLINHLDKIKDMSNGEFKPGVIIRTQIGNTSPLFPGLQHCGDYTEGLKKLLKNVKVIKLYKYQDILNIYKTAYYNAKKGKSTLIIETPQGADKKTWEKIQNAK